MNISPVGLIQLALLNPFELFQKCNWNKFILNLSWNNHNSSWNIHYFWRRVGIFIVSGAELKYSLVWTQCLCSDCFQRASWHPGILDGDETWGRSEDREVAAGAEWIPG